LNDEFPQEVHDTSGTRYPLGALLGRGGQGAVLAVRGRPLAVKLLPAGTPTARARVEAQIARLKRLPLDGLHVARPLRALAPPHTGYVMELMTDMMPLQRITQVPKDKAADFVPWYLETGSLLRRLRLLANTADLFTKLHGRGLAYGDASPNNVFVSDHAEGEEVWLIDCDNISAGAGQRAVYTPGYGAPELLRGHGSDSLTDAWSFATIAFETLCVLHPFVGDIVHDGEPELEEKAFRGELPWVDDPSGENEATRGIPRDMVLSTQLQELAERCFGTSRTDRLARPGVGAWAEKLHRSADQVLVCPGCGSSYYLNNRLCPWCDEPRPAFATAEIYLRDKDLQDQKRNPFHLVAKTHGEPKPVHRVVIQDGRDTVLGERVLQSEGGSKPLATLRLEGSRLSVKGPQEGSYELRHLEGRRVPLDQRWEHIDLGGGMSPWWLVPIDTGLIHRATSFILRPRVST
jgi:DNA-binding helix-hairpin-helix protein with protein kinase domain